MGKRIWPEITRFGGHFASGVETQCCRNILSSMKVILMITSRNGYNIVSTYHLIFPCKSSIDGSVLHSIEMLAKRITLKFPHNSADAKTNGYALQTDSSAPLLRTPSIQLIKHGEVKLVPTWILHLYILVSSLREMQATEREMLTSTQSQYFNQKSVLPTKYVRAMVAQNQQYTNNSNTEQSINV